MSNSGIGNKRLSLTPAPSWVDRGCLVNFISRFIKIRSTYLELNPAIQGMTFQITPFKQKPACAIKKHHRSHYFRAATILI